MSTPAPEYLDLTSLLAVAEVTLGQPAVVRDYGLLEAALARPQAVIFGDEAYPDLDDKAAALLHSLVMNHALVDGNKRLGWVATAVFYELNGYDLFMGEDAAVDFVFAVADGTLDDVKKIAATLSQNRTPL